MDKKEILEALTQINTDLIMAEGLYRRANMKHRVVLSQLAIDWKEELAKHGVDTDDFMRPPAAVERLEHLRQHQNPPVTPQPSPTPAGGQPTTDVNEAVRSGVPASPHSQPGSERAPQAVHQFGQQRGASAPVPNSLRRPTPETDAERWKGPTVEVDKEQQLREKKQEQLGHFVGTGSLFARFLSPQVHAAGKGVLRPGVAGLQKYSDDIIMVPPQYLREWPSGFYRNQQSKALQFMINTPRVIAIVPLLTNFNQLPLVLLQTMASTQLQSIDELELMDILLIKEALEAELRQLSDV